MFDVFIVKRLYGDSDRSLKLQDIIITTMMSDLLLGPKLYGIFPSGRLEELLDVILQFLSKIIIKNIF